MNLYVGTSGYSHKKWKGTFYPQDLPQKSMLRYYGERFGTADQQYLVPHAQGVGPGGVGGR